MNFADDRVTGDADLRGDLAAGHARADEGAQLRDTFRIPGLVGRWGGHEKTALACNAAACSGPPTGRRPRATGRLAGPYGGTDRCSTARMRPRSPSRSPAA